MFLTEPSYVEKEDYCRYKKNTRKSYFIISSYMDALVTVVHSV